MVLKRDLSRVFTFLAILCACLIRFFRFKNDNDIVFVLNIILGTLALISLTRCLMIRNYVVLTNEAITINEIWFSKIIFINNIKTASIRKGWRGNAIMIYLKSGKKYKVYSNAEEEEEFRLLFEKLTSLSKI